jgi:hypothetical protein
MSAQGAERPSRTFGEHWADYYAHAESEAVGVPHAESETCTQKGIYKSDDEGID